MTAVAWARDFVLSRVDVYQQVVFSRLAEEAGIIILQKTLGIINLVV